MIPSSTLRHVRCLPPPLHAVQVDESAPESGPAFPYQVCNSRPAPLALTSPLPKPTGTPQFLPGLSLVHGLARPISVIACADPADGIEQQTWHHVLRVQIHHGVIARIIRWLGSRRPFLPSFLHIRLAAWFPGAFLPDAVVVKGI